MCFLKESIDFLLPIFLFPVHAIHLSSSPFLLLIDLILFMFSTHLFVVPVETHSQQFLLHLPPHTLRHPYADLNVDLLHFSPRSTPCTSSHQPISSIDLNLPLPLDLYPG